MTSPAIRATRSPEPPISDPNSSRATSDGAANREAPVKISSPAAATTGAASEMTLESLSTTLDPSVEFAATLNCPLPRVIDLAGQKLTI